VLQEVSQRLSCPSLPLLRRVILFYHLPYHARAVKSGKKVVVMLAFQLLPVMVSLHEVQLRSDLGIGGSRNVAKDFVDLKHQFHFSLGGRVPARQSV